MVAVRDAYLESYAATPLTILDVGSASIEGALSYKDVFTSPSWRYIGLDMSPGPNVDLVPSHPYHWYEIEDGTIDVVVSGQAFEHIEWPWLTIREIARVLRVNGIAAITAPSSGSVHRFPKDCWRFYPDGLPALAAYGGLLVVETHWDNTYAFPENAMWGDAFAILQTPDGGAKARSPILPLSSRDAVASRTIEELSRVATFRVKWRLISDALRRAARICRTPLSQLRREP